MTIPALIGIIYYESTLANFKKKLSMENYRFELNHLEVVYNCLSDVSESKILLSMNIKQRISPVRIMTSLFQIILKQISRNLNAFYVCH